MTVKAASCLVRPFSRTAWRSHAHTWRQQTYTVSHPHIARIHTSPHHRHGSSCGCGIPEHHTHPPLPPDIAQHIHHQQPNNQPVIESIPLTQQQAKQYLTELTQLKQHINTAHISGNYATALQHQNQATQLTQQLYGTDNARYAVCINNEALFNKQLGNTLRAVHLYKLALNIYAACNEAHTINYGVIAHNIGVIYRDMQQLDDAQTWLNTALNVHQQCNLNNLNAANIATTQYTLASIYRMQHRYDEAIALQLDSLNVLKRKYGSEDATVASAMNNLGYTYKCAGQYDRALQHYSDALHTRMRELPPAHTDTIVTLNNIAELHAAMGNVEHSNKVRQYIVDLVQQSEAANSTTATSGQPAAQQSVER